MEKFKHGQLVKENASGRVGVIMTLDDLLDDIEVKFENEEYRHFKSKQLELVEDKTTVGYFEKLSVDIGKLVDRKQLAYGNSVDKTYKLMQIFLDNYDNGDNTYTIPKSLLKHILLQVRIIDKQNRIFSNPDGDLMEENSYSDTVGYGLLGMKMSEDIKD